MPFQKNDKKDEIDQMSEVDLAQRQLIESHALVSKPVSDLLTRMLRANKKMFVFEGIAKDPGFMQIQIPGDNNKVFQIKMEIVPKTYVVNLEQFKKATNYENILRNLSKFFKYCQDIFQILVKNIEREYPAVLDWKLQVDESNSTMFIDPDHSKRIGFIITQVNLKK
jgi:hypothetical protein